MRYGDQVNDNEVRPKRECPSGAGFTGAYAVYLFHIELPKLRMATTSYMIRVLIFTDCAPNYAFTPITPPRGREAGVMAPECRAPNRPISPNSRVGAL